MADKIVLRIIYCPDISRCLPDISPEYPYHEISSTLKIEYRVISLGESLAILNTCVALFGKTHPKYILLYNVTDKYLIRETKQENVYTSRTLWGAMKGFVVKEELQYTDDIVEYVKNILTDKITQVRFSSEKEHSMLQFVFKIFNLESFTYSM